MIEYEIGRQLKQAREQAGWSLSQAAAETGVSKAMLGQIERGESSPTIATLWKIATGFHRPLSTFVEGLVLDSEDGVVRSNHKRVTAHKTELKTHTLFPFDPRFGFEVFLLELQPGQVQLSEAHDAGVTEHVLVIEGSMDVKLGKRWKKLHKDDTLRFAADQEHGYRNTSEHKAVFHNLIHYH